MKYPPPPWPIYSARRTDEQAFQNALRSISEDPYAGTAKVGDLSGFYCWDVYYARTNYEIAYRIYEEEGKLVVVVLAGTRENFYQELKRYQVDVS